MKARVLKIIIMLTIFMMVFSNLMLLVSTAFTVDEAFSGDTSKVAGAVSATREIIGMILDIIRIVGMGIALIILTYIGIKFMIASPSERANIKQYSINFVIGAFILIGGTGLLTIVKNFALKI